jgi:hypoxanthine-DNA glycosylase
MISGFGPIAGADARVLILGSAPSVRSLELQQYYGHARNAFWPIMLSLFGSGAALDYPARIKLLIDARVAVWDVLHALERPGSLDARIVSASAVPNDIGGFLAVHPDVTDVFFNGLAAQTLFRRHVAPGLVLDPAMTFQLLPSTSPAHAAMSFEMKLQAWSAVRHAVNEVQPCQVTSSG